MRNDENEEVSFRLCVSGATGAVCCVLMVFFFVCHFSLLFINVQQIGSKC